MTSKILEQHQVSDTLYGKNWDVIVVGTGMGGATLGYALAKAGKKVLFLEKGRRSSDPNASFQGDFAESQFNASAAIQDRTESLSKAGRCGEKIVDAAHPRQRELIPFIGAGTGGSSSLYGMALERFFRGDFKPHEQHPHSSDSSLPVVWPVSYDEMLPWYKRAESLYRVRGIHDPLRADETFGYPSEPPPFSPVNQEMSRHFSAQGLHPYHLPMACEYVSGCEACQGYLCARQCKNDSANICLEPAIADYGAEVLDECEVLKIEASENTVSGVVCRHKGKEVILKANLVVLAAGALFTPIILLESASESWPAGLANQSGLVGKNLMRHYVDLYAGFANSGAKPQGNIMTIAFNDFYSGENGKLGSVQSFGYMPPTQIIVDQMQQDIRDSALPWIAKPFGLAKPILKLILGKLFSRAIILASIQEDLPFEENSIRLSQGDAGKKHLHLDYTVRESEQKRIAQFRKILGDVFKPYRVMVLKQAENNERIAHVCGTCRFGDAPVASVLDKNNKAHGLNNLYIVDSSFFPSSGATNPSLTIAANALRVAEHIGRVANTPERKGGKEDC